MSTCYSLQYCLVPLTSRAQLPARVSILPPLSLGHHWQARAVERQRRTEDGERRTRRVQASTYYTRIIRVPVLFLQDPSGRPSLQYHHFSSISVTERLGWTTSSRRLSSRSDSTLQQLARRRMPSYALSRSVPASGEGILSVYTYTACRHAPGTLTCNRLDSTAARCGSSLAPF